MEIGKIVQLHNGADDDLLAVDDNGEMFARVHDGENVWYWEYVQKDERV